MKATARNPNLDNSFSDARLWRFEANALREILLQCGMAEELKWGKPCYAYDGKNICIIQRMKGFLALLFFKGALLTDKDDVLELQGPNSRSGYRMRLTSVEDVANKEESIKSYVREAIEIEKAGLKVAKAVDFDYPVELSEMLADDPDFKSAFEDLTAGRRRGYILHFSDAKQSKTRHARIERCRSKIFEGKGYLER
ncbi:MAG: YdeI/OmpD-associated family protein [Albidovulum sp.]|nr:YdeI/OmpD-associated family protein [Albidovulum sp.]MDE0306448.1 YdeI/OmpD-associated family protein [Albidovulum sp.]MDE0531165.1 YdeI/OmpD-associated family protein [Albidovulum sp.]